MNRFDRRALERATRSTIAAGGDPDVAAELANLRAVRTGAYALMHALVNQMGGGPIEITRAEWKALPPNERLKVKVDPDTNDVSLLITSEAGGPPEVSS